MKESGAKDAGAPWPGQCGLPQPEPQDVCPDLDGGWKAPSSRQALPGALPGQATFP